MTRNALAVVLGVVCWLSAAPAARAENADSTPSAPMRHFDSMRYFILNPSQQSQGVRGITYVNLIGDLNAKSFKVYYEGDIAGLKRTHRLRHLQVILKRAGNVVGTVTVADLSKVRGGIALNKRLMADCTAMMREVDEVDTRIGH